MRRTAAIVVAPLVVAALAVASAGCHDRELSPVAPCVQSGVSIPLRQTVVDKVDVLFMVDNSNSMTEEQENLARNFPTMIRLLATGDTDGDGIANFPPVQDLHVGVVSSDMGTAGYPVPTCSDDGDPDGDDGILVTRGNTTISGCAASYPKFLSFMPATGDTDGFVQQFTCVAVLGTGGCGFEHQLEAPLKAITPSTSAIRFLSGTGHGDGENAGFLRSDSILAVIVMTDEEDCSAQDAEIYDVGSTRFPGEQLNLRCFMYGAETFGAVWPTQRYVDGFLAAVGNDPSRLVFAAITGVPPNLVPDPDHVDYDAILRALTEEIDPTDPNRLRPSCNVPGLGLAFPPPRIVTVARDIAARTATPGNEGGNATVQSICQADFDAALRVITNKIGNLLIGACLPRVLAVRPDGTVDCTVREIIVGDEAGCAGAPGSPPCTTPGEKPGCRQDAQGCCVGVDPSNGEALGQQCTIPQSASAGWFYDTSGGDCGGRPCTPADPRFCSQRIKFTHDYIPPNRALVRIECLQAVTGQRACTTDDECHDESGHDVGQICDPSSGHCVAATCGGGV